MTQPYRTFNPSALTTIAAIASQAAAVTAVLYYFGWAYSRAFFGHFGVDVHLLGYSTQDYVLRSLNGTFYPAAITLFVILTLLAARRLPELHALRSRRPRRTLRCWVAATGATGAALMMAVLLAMLAQISIGSTGVALPLLLIAGATLVGYASHIRRKYQALLRTRWQRRPRPGSTPAVQAQTLVLIALIAMGYLWAVGDSADRKGRAEAKRAEAAHFVDRSSVLVFSTERLAIEGSGATVGEIAGPDEKYRYVYSGLWLLARTPDRYFLIPQQWNSVRDRVFVLRDSDDLRIDIARNP
ncbi:hypothetical protein [Nocardia iowensis]|uniref:Uncharacterized protein n=1 Tax=Nocardia iowensis TaxID=204891 RepID=A0ABX8RI64_NOCIO|nr:hypothetical protein [Nocardia iowensis]QXN89318.1 hypothetical protein KV110_27785 [Nocardia iowensis]